MVHATVIPAPWACSSILDHGEKQMQILILGGTRFVGRHLVTAALARGHEVTLFNRGKHASDAMANVETICGDRKSDLAKLLGRRWDSLQIAKELGKRWAAHSDANGVFVLPQAGPSSQLGLAITAPGFNALSTYTGESNDGLLITLHRQSSIRGKAQGSDLYTLIEDRERREGKTLEEAFDFERQNVELVRRFETLKSESRQGNQSAFQDQVLNTHSAIEQNTALFTAISATSLAGALSGLIADLFVTGGIISLISIAVGSGGVGSALALRDQRAKRIREQMKVGTDATFERFRTSFNETIRSAFHEEADAFKAHCERVFVHHLRELVDEKLAQAEAEREEIRTLMSGVDRIKSEVDDLSRSLGRASNGLS
jgi:hypothetical protein